MIILDTCVILWDAIEPKNLSKKAKQTINEAFQHNEIIISDISLWEIAMLIHKKRIEIDTTASKFMNTYVISRKITAVSITPEIAELSVTLDPEINFDPADRIIAATSIIHNAKLITHDNNLRKSKIIQTVW